MLHSINECKLRRNNFNQPNQRKRCMISDQLYTYKKCVSFISYTGTEIHCMCMKNHKRKQFWKYSLHGESDFKLFLDTVIFTIV